MPAHDAREAAQHVIERDEAVGQDHALDRRVRDVALVPERDVLERRVAVAAKQPREADDLLAADRIALVRHRRRALLPLGERLLDLADLGLLQAADLERELLERRAGDGQRRQQLGVPIALNHLRRDRRRLEPEPPADVGFDRRRQVRERADRARQLADADDRLARARTRSTSRAELRVPERQLQAERHRLGVHAVRAADHRRAAMLERAIADRLGQRVEILQDDVARLAHLQRLRGVDDVRRGQAEVQPARRRPDVLGDRGREGDDVVLGGLLDFLDAGDVEARRARGCRAPPRAARCRRRPSPRRRRFRRAARSRSGAGRSRCAPCRGGCSEESSSVEVKPLARNLAGRSRCRARSPPASRS